MYKKIHGAILGRLGALRSIRGGQIVLADRPLAIESLCKTKKKYYIVFEKLSFYVKSWRRTTTTDDSPLEMLRCHSAGGAKNERYSNIDICIYEIYKK